MSLLTARLCYQFERSLKVHLKVVKETGATPSIRDIQTPMGLPQTIWCFCHLNKLAEAGHLSEKYGRIALGPRYAVSVHYMTT